MRHKYKAKYVYWDRDKRIVIDPRNLYRYKKGFNGKLPENIYRFDSQHEFKVYLELVRMYGDNRVVRQYPIEIISSGWCYPKGKKWKVDFVVLSSRYSQCPEFYIEAKGIITTEFTYILANLEEHQEDIFNGLVLVFPRDIPIKNKVIKSLLNSPFNEGIMTLQDFKKRTSLL